jgi:hypothetical protein
MYVKYQYIQIPSVFKFPGPDPAFYLNAEPGSMRPNRRGSGTPSLLNLKIYIIRRFRTSGATKMTTRRALLEGALPFNLS